MKKLLITSCILAATLSTVFAQKKKDVQVNNTAYGTPFHKGSSTLAIGLGFGHGYGNYYGSVTRTPAFLAYFDHGIVDNLGPGNLGIGGIIAYSGARYEYNRGEARWSHVIVGLRGTWHLTILADKNNKFDPYAGAMAGIRHQTYHDDYPPNSTARDIKETRTYPTGGLFVGAKYNFTPSFGAWSELGYDVAFFKLGINFNF